MSYVFDRNFDAEDTALSQGREPVIGAVYTRTDFDAAVAAAREEGFRTGYAQGMAEASAAAETSEAARNLSALEAIAPALRALFADADRHHAALEAQTVDYLLAVFEQLAPDVRDGLSAGQALREARAAVRMALGSAELRLYLAPEAVEDAGAEVRRVARQCGFGGRLEIAPDPALAVGAVRAEWDHGVMRYSFDDLCARILGHLGQTQQDIARRLAQQPAGDRPDTAGEQT
ncbi:hypothetical protein [Sagittula salina]|uniref:Flagellar assembly protein FliH/Type III secretion system HrpE domain-containing protein n=1 Tax=Sagittula salina TaxID=2820268 RepID=A0A940S4Y3_9RHOB|nr:hypothetical protein [Sagittula salina]MBP0484594.1 hypothetical protein [Sagittula salina]